MLNRRAVSPLLLLTRLISFLAETEPHRTGNVNLPQIGQLAAVAAAFTTFIVVVVVVAVADVAWLLHKSNLFLVFYFAKQKQNGRKTKSN